MAANHYATLGVAPHSPREVIRAAYVKLMRRYHPDRNPSAEAAARVRAITAAYAVLSVAEERARYDATRSRRPASMPEPASGWSWPQRATWSALISASGSLVAPIIAAAGTLPRVAERVRLPRARWAALMGGGAAMLALVAYAVPAWVVPEKAIERAGVGGKTITSASLPKQDAAIASDPALCSSEEAAQSITRELFRRASTVPGSNAAALEHIAASSLVRFASPVVHSSVQQGAMIGCKARVVLHLPFGVRATGGKQSVDGVVAYTFRGAGAGTGFSLRAEPALVKALAFLAETSSEAAADLVPPIIAEAPPAVQPAIASTSAPGPAPASMPATKVRRPQAEPRIVEQHPSFSCSGQRNWAERSVCTSASLAALDRAMSSLLGDAMERGNVSQRALLLASDERFLLRRNQCSSESCVRDAYLSSMNTIRAITSSAPAPQ